MDPSLMGCYASFDAVLVVPLVDSRYYIELVQATILPI